MSEIPGMDAAVYEFLNLAIASLALFLAFVFGKYLLLGFLRSHAKSRYLCRYEARAAFSFVLLAGGEAGLRGWTWVARHGSRVGWDIVTHMVGQPYAMVPAVFGAIQIAGLVLAARTLNPNVLAWEMTAVLMGLSLLATLFT